MSEDARRIVDVRDLKKTFRLGFFRKKVEAVKGIGFHVTEGEIFGLLGPNGAGKTTTLKMMMGLIRPTSGSIELMGVDASRPTARKDVGFLPENPYFHEYLNPRELLEFYGRLVGMPRARILERRDELIEEVGLKDAARRPLKKFSKGMLQRIGLAQAMMAQPKLLVLDEPMSGLDPIGRKFVTDLLVDLNSRGTTIIFSSHILSDVERLCSRVVILNRGLKVAEGAIDDLVNEEGDATFESLFVRKALEVGDGEAPRS